MGRSATAAADLNLYFRPDPKNSPTIKVLKHNIGLDTGGSTHAMHNFSPFTVFNGPGILCLEAVCSANGASISAGLEAYIVTTEED